MRHASTSNTSSCCSTVQVQLMPLFCCIIQNVLRFAKLSNLQNGSGIMETVLLSSFLIWHFLAFNLIQPHQVSSLMLNLHFKILDFNTKLCLALKKVWYLNFILYQQIPNFKSRKKRAKNKFNVDIFIKQTKCYCLMTNIWRCQINRNILSK